MDVSQINTLYNIFSTQQLTTKKNTSISFKPKHKSYFYITGEHYPCNSKHIASIDIDRQKSQFAVSAFCDTNPSLDLQMHAFSHLTSKPDEDNIFIHLHGTKNILSYTCLLHHLQLQSISRYFPEITPYRIAENIPYISEYESDSSGQSLAIHIHDSLRNHDIVVLENHGIVAKGNNCESLIDMILELDFYCDIAIRDDIRMYHT